MGMSLNVEYFYCLMIKGVSAQELLAVQNGPVVGIYVVRHDF